MDTQALPFVLIKDRHKLPCSIGVYFALTDEGKVVYIGKTKNLNQRWFNHGRGIDVMLAGCTRIAYLEVATEDEAQAIEVREIKKYRPELNKKDNGNESRIWASIPGRVHADLGRAAQSEGLRMSELIATILESFVDDYDESDPAKSRRFETMLSGR